MAIDPTYKDDLRVAYDADVERRSAVTPASWRCGIIDDFAESIRSDDVEKVLDLGCGTGQMAEHLMGQGFDVTAIDLSLGNVEATRERGVHAEVADFASLPFNDNSFDAAYAMYSLLHVPIEELPNVFTEISRVLVTGATLLIIVWGGETADGPLEDEWLDPPRYFSTYSDDDLLEIETPCFIRKSFKTLDVEEDHGNLHSQILSLESI